MAKETDKRISCRSAVAKAMADRFSQMNADFKKEKESLDYRQSGDKSRIKCGMTPLRPTVSGESRTVEQVRGEREERQEAICRLPASSA